MADQSSDNSGARDNQFLAQKQAEILLENSRTAVAVNISIAFLTYLAIPAPHHFWLWLIIGVALIRLAFYFWMKGNTAGSIPMQWGYLLTLALTHLQGASWGIASIILYNTGSAVDKFYLIAIICGMCGGAIMTLAPSLPAFACFTLPATVPLVIALLMETDSTLIDAGFMGIIFIVAVHAMARRINRSNSELLLSHRNLEKTGQELAEHKERLETLVTKRTRELEESREKYRRLSEEINDVIFELDIHLNIKYISPVISLLLGHRADDFTGVDFRKLVYQDDIQLVEELFTQDISSTPMQSSEFRLINRTGRPHWIRNSNRAIVENGQQIGLRGLLTDIDNQKQAEEEKNKLLLRFYDNQRFEAIGTLAGGIAHDFNNLLMGIEGRSSLIALSLDPTDPNAEHVKAIEQHVRNATTLTTQLLATARGGKYDPKPIDLQELIEQSTAMFQRTQKNIEIFTELSSDPVIVEAEKSQLEQVLFNMLINASQAMPQGGELRLACSIVRLDSAFCAPYEAEPGRYAKLSISDTGIGMDEKTRHRVFDPFFTTKEKSRGTGLGLSSAYGIIKNHKGFITVTSSLGHGSTFTVYLPLSTRQPVAIEPKTPQLIKGSETVLLVDDEEMILEVGQALLSALDYKVVVAQGGEQAIDYLQNDGGEIDLVILDMIMPKMDGAMTFQRIREIHPGLPVILSSGYSLDGQAREIMQSGCNGFLQKPFNLAMLSQKIRDTLKTD